MQDTSKHRLLGTKGSLTGEIPCNPSVPMYAIKERKLSELFHAFSLILSFYLGVFSGIFVINLMSMNKTKEDEDEYQKH